MAELPPDIEEQVARALAEDIGPGDAWLGVFTHPLSDEFAEYWGLPQEGGLIVSTVVGAAAVDGGGDTGGPVTAGRFGSGGRSHNKPPVM